MAAAKEIANGGRRRRSGDGERSAIEQSRVIELVDGVTPRIVLVAAEIDDLARMEQRRMHGEHLRVRLLDRNGGAFGEHEATHIGTSQVQTETAFAYLRGHSPRSAILFEISSDAGWSWVVSDFFMFPFDTRSKYLPRFRVVAHFVKKFFTRQIVVPNRPHR